MELNITKYFKNPSAVVGGQFIVALILRTFRRVTQSCIEKMQHYKLLEKFWFININQSKDTD